VKSLFGWVLVTVVPERIILGPGVDVSIKVRVIPLCPHYTNVATVELVGDWHWFAPMVFPPRAPVGSDAFSSSATWCTIQPMLPAAKAIFITLQPRTKFNFVTVYCLHACRRR